MAKEYVFQWQIAVPKALADGAYFDRWDEDLGVIESNCCFQVDEDGFYLYWLLEGKEAQLLDLTQVSEARQGPLPKDPKVLYELEQRGPRESLEERSLMLVNGLDFVNTTNTHLVAQDVATAKVWLEGLQTVLHRFRVYHICPMTCLRKHWKMLCLSVNERRKIPVRSITRTFASGKTEKMVMQCLVELGLCLGGKNEEIEPSDFTFEKFYELYLKICPRTEVQEIFMQLNNGNENLTVDQLVSFFNERQRDPRLNEILFPFYDRARVLQLINKYETNKLFRNEDRMSVDGFLRMLMSDDNAPVFLSRIELYQEMDQPLCHYFINSSHNTYLSGRQFGGRSSVEIYRQVLLSGCRCIELDCWNGTGDDKSEPIITHGKAMCTDVLFKDVILAIKETAFVTSEFPVILSFENHCSKANQLKMARYCMDILGDLLLSRSIDGYALEPGAPLPSPNLLKRKILIKNKRLKPDVERRQLEQFLKEGRLDDEGIDDTTETPNVVVGEDGNVEGEPPSSAAAGEEAHPELKAMQSSSEAFTFKGKLKSLAQLNKPKEPQLSQEEEERLLAMYHYTGATTTIHPLLSSLVNYTHPVKFQSFDIAEQNNCPFHMSSFSESTGLAYLKQSAIEFVNYNKRQLSRIYPKGGRVDSSNFLPQIFWNAGVQMVALNFQTPDLPMQLNQGKFEYNGNCGYLLKPDFMRRPDRMFDPFSESPVDGVIAAYCSVRVISGQFLSDKKIGTCVEVEMYGLPTDTIRKEFRTRVVPANGLNPIYNEEPFVFRKVVLPELAVLRIAVYDENNKLLGQRILPLDGLQAGYRHISLRTETNLPMTLPTVFCHIVLKTYIPEGLGDFVEALTDPKGFHADLEKRQKQMEAMGIKREDIGEVLPARKQGSKGSSGGLSTVNSVQTSNSSAVQQPLTSVSSQSVHCPREDKERQETRMAQLAETVKVDELRKDKAYLKLLKKHQKDVEDLRKRHGKERSVIQKQQAAAVEKYMAEKSKFLRPFDGSGPPRRSSNGSLPAGRTQPSNSHRPVSPSTSDTPEEGGVHDERLRALIIEQTQEYSGLVRKQREEEHRLNRSHMESEWDLLEKLLDDAHKKQFVQLKQQLEIESKELRELQTKKSCEDSRTIQQDKSIKTKAEKDRRVKEIQEKNLKVFFEERKRLALKHQRHHDQMSKIQVEQKEGLRKEAKRALEMEDQSHLEALLAVKPETVV